MKTLTVEAKVENIPRVTAFIDELLEALGCPLKAQMQIDVAIDEMLVNIASYAYNSEPGDATVNFEYDEPTRTASITFIDSGMPFDPVQKEDPDITLSAEERGIGGLGIYLVKKTMDAMEYARRDGKNILTIRKKL